jgi:hypothetical protein
MTVTDVLIPVLWDLVIAYLPREVVMLLRRHCRYHPLRMSARRCILLQKQNGKYRELSGIKNLRNATFNGSINFLEWLYQKEQRTKMPGPQLLLSTEDMDHDLTILAASSEPEAQALETLKWLEKRKLYKGSVIAANCAAVNGYVMVMQWLRRRNPPCPWNEWTCAHAAEHGKPQMVQWLRAQDPQCPWDENSCLLAAETGELKSLQMLRAQDPPCPWSVHVYSRAAASGQMEVVQWLHAQDPQCPWNIESIDNAIWNGWLEIVQWLRAQDPPCPWGESSCSIAAWNGQLVILQWLRAQDPPCPWDEYTCTNAAEYGELEILQWLRAQHPPCPWRKADCLRLASGDMREWIESQPE